MEKILGTPIGLARVYAQRFHCSLHMSPTDSNEFALLDGVQYGVHMTLVRDSKNHPWQVKGGYEEGMSIYIAGESRFSYLQPSDEVRETIVQIVIASLTEWTQANEGKLLQVEQEMLNYNIQQLEQRKAKLTTELNHVDSELDKLKSRLFDSYLEERESNLS